MLCDYQEYFCAKYNNLCNSRNYLLTLTFEMEYALVPHSCFVSHVSKMEVSSHFIVKIILPKLLVYKLCQDQWTIGPLFNRQ